MFVKRLRFDEPESLLERDPGTGICRFESFFRFEETRITVRDCSAQQMIRFLPRAISPFAAWK